MLKQTISQKMLQKLSPQQIQLMKLLQVPTVSLEQRIKEELEINPALEEGMQEDEVGNLEASSEEEFGEESSEQESSEQEEAFELDDYLKDYMEDDPTSYKTKGDSYSASEDDDKTIPIAIENSFHDHLERQIGMLDLEGEDQEVIALQIIGSIDEDGYLRREPASIMDDLLFAQNINTSEQEINSILKQIQQFDPPGTGARDLQECLTVQLRLKVDQEQYKNIAQAYSLEVAHDILLHHFDEFGKKHYEKLMRKMDINSDELKGAIEEIVKLNPKPASGFTDSINRSLQYVVPDFIITNREGELELTLNSKNAPDLHINDQYIDMLRNYRIAQKNKKVKKRDKETVVFIKQKIDSAKWFIDAIRQRQLTLHNTMYSIMQYQYDFFLTGDQKKLRPMILKDIADITGLDISTISRVVNSKYVQTEFGTKRLKEFFSESLQTSDGAEVSTLEVKNILSEMIQAENKQKPLSDEKLKDILQEKGYNIARRTVAKYREQLGIPVARLRKEL
jgi:RNA polymerase sigma-54 factor